MRDRRAPRLLPPSAAALTALCLGAQAQTPNAPNFVIGPVEAPIGCPIKITFSNDAPGVAGIDNCPFEVYDELGNLVFTPSCPPQFFDLLPGGFIFWDWPQVDQAGQPVPPGRYRIRAFFETGATVEQTVDVGAVEAGVVLLGEAGQQDGFGGFKRPFFLCSPQDPGAPYWLLGSLGTSPGLPTCGGRLPLNVDPLFNLTLQPNELLLNSQGLLNGQGESMAPALEVPSLPALLGQQFSVAFLALDFAAPCPVRRVSGAHTMTIIP